MLALELAAGTGAEYRSWHAVRSIVQDKMVSNAVIALKSKIEKIREQSQNIE